jgi:hypothetical protein
MGKPAASPDSDAYVTAVVGLLVTRHAHYGAIPVLLIVLACLAIIRLLHSSIGPDGWYPVSVALGTSTLAAFCLGRGWLMKALT